jgi:ATP-dependent protease ClpP protease subunit
MCHPDAHFLLHGVAWSSPANIPFEEKQIKEIERGLKRDRKNISKILAESCKKNEKEIEDIIFKGKILTARQAKKLGLVHEIIDLKVGPEEEMVVL